MNAKLFMNAVGGISGDTIAKYADPSPAASSEKAEKKARKMKYRLYTAAAAMVLIIGFSLTKGVIMNFGEGSGTLFSGCQPMVREGDQPNYATVSEIVEASDDIIVGEAISSGKKKEIAVYADSTQKTAYIVFSIRVIEVINGGLNEGDVIEVKQLTSTDRSFEKGSLQLLFLAAFDELPYSTVNSEQGSVEIRDGKLYSDNKYSLFGYNDHPSLDSVLEELRRYVK